MQLNQKTNKNWGNPPGCSDGEASAYNVGDPGSIPELGRPLGEENGNPLQYSCLENPMDGGFWQVTVHGVSKGWTNVWILNKTLIKNTWVKHKIMREFSQNVFSTNWKQNQNIGQ